MKKREYNFWPSFTDLMLSFVLVLLLILSAVSIALCTDFGITIKTFEKEKAAEQSVMDTLFGENLNVARSTQEIISDQITDELKSGYNVVVKDKNGKDISNSDSENKKPRIFITNKLDRQTIAFSDGVLFDTAKVDLKTRGQELLGTVGKVLNKNLGKITEIQIQGHADMVGNDAYNLELASKRAMSVYNFLQKKAEIDPAQHLMSATTFGKYKPVGRDEGKKFDKFDLIKANATEKKKGENRRIEILVFYDNDNGNRHVLSNNDYVLIAERCVKYPQNISLAKYEVKDGNWTRLDSFDVDYDVSVAYGERSRYDDYVKAVRNNKVSMTYRKCAQCNENHFYGVCTECGKIFCHGAELQKDAVVNCPWCATKYITVQAKDGGELTLITAKEKREIEKKEKQEELRKKMTLGANEAFIAGKCAKYRNHYTLYKYNIHHDGKWQEIDGFRVDYETAMNEGFKFDSSSFETAIKNNKWTGNVKCPQCLNDKAKVYYCGKCRKLYCTGKELREGDHVECPWCGKSWTYHEQ